MQILLLAFLCLSKSANGERQFDHGCGMNAPCLQQKMDYICKHHICSGTSYARQIRIIDDGIKWRCYPSLSMTKSLGCMNDDSELITCFTGVGSYCDSELLNQYYETIEDMVLPGFKCSQQQWDHEVWTDDDVPKLLYNGDLHTFSRIVLSSTLPHDMTFILSSSAVYSKSRSIEFTIGAQNGRSTCVRPFTTTHWNYCTGTSWGDSYFGQLVAAGNYNTMYSQQQYLNTIRQHVEIEIKE